MGRRFLVALLAALCSAIAVVAPCTAQTQWTTFHSEGEGFSIDTPGESRPTDKPGHYVYGAGDWSLFVTVDPINQAVRELVENHEREATRQFLARVGNGLVRGGNATQVATSTEDFAGYPSLLMYIEGKADNLEFEGINRLVLTEEHLYILVTVGPKGSSRSDAERFLDSFHLTRSAPAPPATRAPASAPPAAPPVDPIVAKLTVPMLAVARLITTETMNPRIDDLLQRTPAAERLGSRWNPSHAAWPKARKSFTDRIALIAGMYEQSGEVQGKLQATISELSKADADAFAAALNGPQGAAILRQDGLIEFLSTIMADDPDAPKPGDPGWNKRTGQLKLLFDKHAGPAMPAADGLPDGEAKAYFDSDVHRVSMKLWGAVVGKAVVQLQGAINLLIFDDREAITREIEAAIGQEK